MGEGRDCADDLVGDEVVNWNEDIGDEFLTVLDFEPGPVAVILEAINGSSGPGTAGDLFFAPESTEFSKEILHERERFSASVTLPLSFYYIKRFKRRIIRNFHGCTVHQ